MNAADPLVRVEVARDALEPVRRATLPGGRRLSAAVPRHPLGNFFWLAIALSWLLGSPSASSAVRAAMSPA